MDIRRPTRPTTPPIDPHAVDASEEQSGQRPPRKPSGLSEDGRLRTGRLAGLSMGRAIWVLSWPILIESVLNSLVMLTDTIWAARLPGGEAATDAIGGASYILWFIGLVIMALGVGATALVSRAVGAGKMAVANAALGQTLILAVSTGFVVALVVAWLAAPVAGVLNMTDEASSAFTSYMRIVALGVPIQGILYGGIACARGAGDSLRPLIAMAVVNIVNIVLSWILSGADISRNVGENGERVIEVLLENPFSFDLGVAGIGLGTVIAHTVGAAIILHMAISGTWGIRLKRRRLRPHWHTIRRLARLGIPNFIETFGMWVGNFLVLLMVGMIGAQDGGVLGAHIIGIRLESFSFLPGFAMGAAAATLVGQYLGAGAPKLARTAAIRCAFVAAGLMGTFGAAFLLLPDFLVSLISSQTVHMELAPPLLFIAGWVQIPFAFTIVFRSALRGAGDVRVVMMITWFTAYGIRLPLAWALSGVDLPLPGGGVFEHPFVDEPTLTGLWLALCLEVVLRSVVFTFRFAQGTWMSAKV